MASDPSDPPPHAAAGAADTRLHGYLARFGHRRPDRLGGYDMALIRAYGSAVEVDTPDAILRGERTALHAIFTGRSNSRARFGFALEAPDRARHLDAVILQAVVDPGAHFEQIRLMVAGRAVASFDDLALTGPLALRLPTPVRPLVAGPISLTIVARFRRGVRVHFESAGVDLLG